MFGKLSWSAIPFDQPIPLFAAALVGVDIDALLRGARASVECAEQDDLMKNPAALYAARNRAVITDCQHDQYDIKVEVEGRDTYEELSSTAFILRQAKLGDDVVRLFAAVATYGAVPLALFDQQWPTRRPRA